MKNRLLTFLMLVFSQIIFPQEKTIRGKVLAGGNYVEGIHVVNLVNEKETITNEKGEFQILAKEDDLLVFSGLNFEYKRKLVEADDWKFGEISVSLIPKATQLDVVEITEYRINAVDLGILSKPAKQYTPAERRLKAASQMTAGLIANGYGPGVGAGLDPILNAISGRTKMLKKALEIERKEMALEKINGLYDDVFFAETLKIPAEHMERFKYYVVEDKELREHLNAKNKTFLKLRFIQLAANFNELTNEE